jgi:hypothetical protein
MKAAPTLSEWLKTPRFARLIILDATEYAIDQHNEAVKSGGADDE